MNSEQYTASSIQIKSVTALNHFYLRVPDLAQQYSRPPKFIYRLLEAAELFGKDTDWVESRYLDNEYPRCPEFNTFYAEYLKEKVDINNNLNSGVKYG